MSLTFSTVTTLSSKSTTLHNTNLQEPYSSIMFRVFLVQEAQFYRYACARVGYIWKAVVDVPYNLQRVVINVQRVVDINQ